MKKRVLIVTEAGNAWPSGWVRALIYKDLFHAHNIKADYMSRHIPGLINLQSRFDSSIFASISGRINYTLSKIREKLIILNACRGYDTIYLQKVYSLELISALRRVTTARLVLDINDAVWLPAWDIYTKGKLSNILSIVDAITCDNLHGLSFVRCHNPNVFHVPDPSQVEIFDRYRNNVHKSNESLVLGWIGSASTTFNLFLIWEALETVFSRHQNIEFHIIGTGSNRALLPQFERVKYMTVPSYTQNEMVRYILGMDIGLFPLFEVEGSRARGVLKATLYMSGDAAIIASPCGQVPELIQDGVNGMLANSTSAWIDKLELLITDHDLRKRIATEGLETARRDFNLEKSFECLLRALDLKEN